MLVLHSLGGILVKQYFLNILLSLFGVIGCSKEDSSFILPEKTSTYYISVSGNDNNDGRSPETPWKTIARVNAEKLKPGSSILFKSNETFHGTLNLSHKSGSKISPITIGSFGGGKATIDAGKSGSGILAKNCSNIRLRELIVKGDGYKENTSNGIFFYTDSSVIMQNIEVQDIEVFGFMGRGLFFNVPSPEETTNPDGQLPPPGHPAAGYDGILINNVEAHDNGVAGIETGGYWKKVSGQWATNYNHKNITVRNCKAYNNHGVSDYLDHLSGSGILISSVDRALVEYCEAFNNGEENGLERSGPIGIWLTEVKNGIIQFCQSHHNKGGRNKDGGGFDIDGGSQHCVIQYCYSHDNEGAGLAVFEWGSGNPMFDITLRYNISENDGLKNHYGGISLWSVKKTENVKIHNNTVYVSSTSVKHSTVLNAVRIFDEQEFTDLKFFNNILISDGPDARILNGDVRTGIWENNIYWNANGSQTNGFVFGKHIDPKLVAPGPVDLSNPNTKLNITSLIEGYTPAPGSPAINAGLTLGVPMSSRDYKGILLPFGNGYDIGALEYH
jgi:hypothetical protein